MAMKNIKELLSPSDAPTVKEAVQSGMAVRMPNLLDDYTVMTSDDGYPSDDAIRTISYEVAEKHDIGATDAEDIVRGTLTDLGVEL